MQIKHKEKDKDKDERRLPLPQEKSNVKKISKHHQPPAVSKKTTSKQMLQ